MSTLNKSTIHKFIKLYIAGITLYYEFMHYYIVTEHQCCTINILIKKLQMT